MILNRIKILTLILLVAVDFALADSEQDWVNQMFNPNLNTPNLIPEFDDAYGIAFRDINDDGLPDIFVTRFRELNRLLINKGKGEQFIDKTIQTGLGGNLAPRRLYNLELGANIVDYNNDGLLDVVTIGWGRTTVINKQLKGFDFTNVTNDVGIEHPISGNAGIFSDINIDGKLDLIITDEHNNNRLFIQNNTESFSNENKSFGLVDNDVSQGVGVADLNLDGYPDLYICNWFEPDLMYLNVNGTRFEKEQLYISHLKDSLNTNSVSLGDLDNDGDLDMVVTDRNSSTKLYRNDLDTLSGEFGFSDFSALAGLYNRYPSYSSIIADFNNDGLQDVFFTNIGPNQLFINRGDLKFDLVFEENLAEPEYPDENYSTGAAVADIDNDGDLDLFVSNKDKNCKLYVNPLEDSNFIRIELNGVYSNKDAIGAKIWLYDETSSQLVGYREILNGEGYLSTSELIAHFGVKNNTSYSAHIKFPSGRIVDVSQLEPNKKILINEVDGFLKYFIVNKGKINSIIRKDSFLPSVLLVILLISLISTFIYLAIKRYSWRSRQTTIFIIIIISVLFIFWVGMRTRPITELLGTQNIVIIAILMFTIGFMEKLRQVNNKRYEYRKVLHRFSEELIFIRSNIKIYNQLVTMIQGNLSTSFVGIVEISKYATGSTYFLPKEFITWKKFELSDEQKIILTANTVVDKVSLLKDFSLIADEIDIAIPIKRQNKIFSLLLLSNEGSKPFKNEDITLLTTIANQASLAVENNIFIEETKKLTKSLTESRIEKKYVNELEDKNRNLEELYNELKETQSQLIQSEKMSSLGQLVAGVAHELNNPIGYLYANMKELQKYIEILRGQSDSEEGTSSEYLHDDIKQIILESMEGSERVKSIVENLRKFSRLDEAEFKYADIHEGLVSTIMLVKKELGDRIKLHKDFIDIPKINCMPGQLNQVFLNLFLNAIQAIEGEGNVWVSTKLKDDKVLIKIKDDGKGIPKKSIDKIFEPFYTTKPTGMGTGLGLSISYGIIQEHGGEIKVKSKKDHGTTFTISIPFKPKQ